MVVPKDAAEGNPWVWRARFPGYHAEADVLLLERGLHIAFIDTNGLLGSLRALKHWDAFYELMTGTHGLAKKPALEAVSRGGLFAYRWATKHPDRVACIYADTPVCDIKSWPLGQGKGVGSEGTWKTLLAEYGFTQDEALAFKENPIDVLAPIAAAKIPLLHIVSLTDVVVPPEENTLVLAKRADTGFSVKDTAPEINAAIFEGMMRRGAGERLVMGMEMQATARALVWASIPADLPEEDRRREFYRRFFGEDYPFWVLRAKSRLRVRHLSGVNFHCLRAYSSCGCSLSRSAGLYMSFLSSSCSRILATCCLVMTLDLLPKELRT